MSNYLSNALAARRFFALALLLLALSVAVRAQPTTPVPTAYRNTVFISPAEVFYKFQAGYERKLGANYGLGVQVAAYPGFRELYKGWHTTLFGRFYFSEQNPCGWYMQAQASIYEHEQLTSIIPINNARYGYGTSSYRWSGLGGGAGGGLGYRLPVLKEAFSHRFSIDGMLGIRLNWRPQPRFDQTTYRVTSDFLPDSFEWYTVGPGSLVHGLLTAGYSF